MPSPALPGTALGAVLAVASGLLVACGTSTSTDGATGDGSDRDDSAGGSSLLPEAEGTVDYPVTLDTSWGEVTLEERPERVVAGSWRGDLSWLLALGVTPVAVDSIEVVGDLVPWSEDLAAEPIEYSWSSEKLALAPEPIAAAAPDLVAAGSLGAEPVPNLEQVEAVAPVLAQPDTREEYASWQRNIALLGEALDLEGRAQQVVDDYDAFFADFREQHPAFEGRTVAYLEYFGGDELYFGNPEGSAVEQFFSRQGFDVNPTDLSDAEPVSRELLGRVEGDVLMIVDYTADDRGASDYAELVDSALFRSIPAVRADNVVALANPDRTTLFTADGEELGPVAHPSVAYDDPIGSPPFADLLAPLLEEQLQP